VLFFLTAGHGDTLAVGVAFAIVVIFLAVFTAVLGSAFYCWYIQGDPLNMPFLKCCNFLDCWRENKI